MTEEEWLASAHPSKMLDYLDSIDALTDRKQRLLDCACVRRLWHLLHNAAARGAVEAAERYADGTAELEELREAQGEILAVVEEKIERRVRVSNSADRQEPVSSADSIPALSAAAGTAWEYRGGTDPLAHAAHALSVERVVDDDPAERLTNRARLFAEQRHQVVLVREIFGNPFQQVAFSHDWQTDTAVLLARQMYKAGDFSAMPILADALQDTGCDNDDILDHCRDPQQVHVRGCWVVDLILGKE